MGRYSRPYKRGRRLFRYDFERCIVECVCAASEEMKKEEADWIEKHGRPLYGIDDQGLMSYESVGLRRENWMEKSARNEYLDEWNAELDEELSCMMRFGL